MKDRFNSEVANGVAAVGEKRKYVSPEIEVIDLDETPKLLSASAVQRSFGAGLGDDDEESW